jgi:hypothetical protein
MNISTLRQLRLQNQQISTTHIASPEEMVSFMLAVQAQVYPMAKWAIGLRLRGSTDQQVEDAYNAGKILRTHVLRPTWHFVSPSDIRWLLKLTGPRVQAFCQSYYKKFELDKKLFKKCNEIFIKSLQGGRELTRTALQAELKKAKINAAGIRLAFLMMQAELDGIICSGKREGKQFPYALLEERVAAVKQIDRERSLSLLAHKYFKSRGPATVNDFSWWCGLPISECREAIAMLNDEFVKENINGKEYIYCDVPLVKSKLADRSFFMPDYDEYGIAYKDRSVLFDKRKISEKAFASLGFPHVLVIDGIISGTWKIIKKGREVRVLETQASRDLLIKHQGAIARASKRFNEFTELRT